MTSTDLRASAELVDLIANDPNDPNPIVHRRMGVVQTVDWANGVCSVQLAGSALTVTGIRFMRPYQPQPNDTVWLLEVAGDYLAIGSSEIGAARTEDAATVATDQSTTSLTYTNLTTSGPAVSILTGTRALVAVTAGVELVGTTGVAGYMAVAVSGATTIAATDAIGGYVTVPFASYFTTLAAVFEVTGLTPGINTFTAKYHTDSVSFAMHFKNRYVYARDLP